MEMANWRRCFERVLFHDCQLTPEQDTYGEGTLLMFYSMFHPGFLDGDVSRYHYLFLMEPDARPIRPYWVQGMLEAVRGPLFWVKGSVPRYPTTPDDIHINGNAFFRLNDAKFSRFLLESRGAFKYYLSFDQSLHAHRSRALNPQDTAHLFVATEFIVNNWRGYTYWTLEDAWRELPDTYIIHGKQAVKAACRAINCTGSMFGSMSRFGG